MTKPARRVLLFAGVLAVLAAGGLVARKWDRVLAILGRDRVNQAEADALRAAALKGTLPADAAAGWPQWRGPARDGVAAAGPFRTDWDKHPPKRLWSAPCGGGFSSPAVAGGRVFTQDRQGGTERVICLDAATGMQLWEHAYPADYTGTDPNFAVGPRATPVVAGGRVYAVGGAGECVCLDAAGGAVVWRHDLLAEFGGKLPQWGVAGSPLVEADLVVVQPGGPGAAAAAFDAATGALRWKAGSGPAGYSSPVAATVGGVRGVFALTGDALLCVGTDGRVMSTYSWKTDHNGNIATPLVVDDYVFISSAYNRGCALLRTVPDGGGLRLERVYERPNKVMRNHFSTCVYRDGFLYGFDGNRPGRLTCVNFRELAVVEEWEASRAVDSGTLILAGRHLVIQTERGDLALVEATPEEFRLVGRVPNVLTGPNTWSTPALADGRLFLRDGEKVVCYDVGRE